MRSYSSAIAAVIVGAGSVVFAQIPAPEQTDLETRKFRLEQQRFDLERSKNLHEEYRQWTALVVTVLGAGAAVWKHFRDAAKAREDAAGRLKAAQQEDERRSLDAAQRHAKDLQLKALELAMDAESPGAVANRMNVIRTIVQGANLPVIEKKEVENWGFGTTVRRREALIALLAAAPDDDRRQSILHDWHRAFPNDKWIKEDNGKKLVLDGSTL